MGMSVKIKRAQQSDVILDLSNVVWCVRGTEVWDIRGRVCWRVFTWHSAAAADFKAALEQEANPLFIDQERYMGLRARFSCAPRQV